MITISLLVDLAVAALLVLAAHRGGKKGLIRMATGLIILVLSLALGGAAFYLLTEPLTEALMPFALEHFPAALPGETVEAATRLFLRHCLGGGLFSAFFVLALIALDTLVKALDLMAKLPVLHQANSLGGAVLGVAEGALLLFAAVWVAGILGYPIPEDITAGSIALRLFDYGVQLMEALFR